MQRSRTIKTLAALLAALVIGTFVLLVLETRPATVGSILPLVSREGYTDPVAAIVKDVAVPLLRDRWTNIVIHDSICDMTGSAETDCHFVILAGDADGVLVATHRWRQQGRGAHITVPGHDFNATSIGICIAGDLAAGPPSAAQLQTLRTLTRILQRKFDLPAHRVYTHGDLTASHCPGDDFPTTAFRSHLLTFRR